MKWIATSRYWRRAGWRWGIGAAVLAASLAGPGVYWLKGKYQRDLTEIQQAYHQEKAHAERLTAEMARLRKELEEARVQAEKPEDVRWPPE